MAPMVEIKDVTLTPDNGNALISLLCLISAYREVHLSGAGISGSQVTIDLSLRVEHARNQQLMQASSDLMAPEPFWPDTKIRRPSRQRLVECSTTLWQLASGSYRLLVRANGTPVHTATLAYGAPSAQNA